MIFCNFFSEYENSLKKFKRTVLFKKHPLHHRVLIILFNAYIFLAVLYSISILLRKDWLCGEYILLSEVILYVIGIIIDSIPKVSQTVLEETYKPCAVERMKMIINILYRYNIDFNNPAKIDSLIEAARCEQRRCIFKKSENKQSKSSLSIVTSVVNTIFAAAMQKIFASFTLISTLHIVRCLMIIVFYLWIFNFMFKDSLEGLLYYRYNLYEEFIDDLRQIKLSYIK